MVPTGSGKAGLPERASVAALRSRPTADVLIIGGGINGLSTFRDLALQGVDVALVEQGDYLSGASSASSHMIHGGVRYLENGEFRLVAESIQERNRLLRIAPHFVHPLLTTIPIFSTLSGVLSAPLRFLTHRQGKPKARGVALIKVGLILYDLLSRSTASMPRHTLHGKKRALRELTHLNPRLKYTANYYDAAVQEPERLGLDVLHDGVTAGQLGQRARASNYLAAVGASDGATLLRDCETGEGFAFTAKVVINASGAWTDLTNGALGRTTELIGGTKGSHIVLDNRELFDACHGRELFFENNDGRIVLIQPIKNRVMVGTTDIEADPALPAICTEDEVDYFFDLVSYLFPRITVDRTQIVYRFSGIRPLPRHEDTKPGFVSRDYNIVPATLPGSRGVPLLSLVGGKWTTFRALGERLSREVLALLGAERTVSTTDLPIGGGAGYPLTPAERRDWIAMHRDTVPVDRAQALLSRYGTRAIDVIDEILEGFDAPLRTDTTFSSAEIRYLVRTESVVRLTDLVFRRTNYAFTGTVSSALLEELAHIVAGINGWDKQKMATEVQDTIDVLRDSHGVQLAALEAAAHFA